MTLNRRLAPQHKAVDIRRLVINNATLASYSATVFTAELYDTLIYVTSDAAA
jgi:hypothetical protein